ncbi:MAG: carbohydrate-binding module family 20 domain-containing protein, partial [Verrucomicrobiales bacterium]|nr:carbohydrate-binding module family 20 domain-containing protein [Verrucomicrobiales bacterium]
MKKQHRIAQTKLGLLTAAGVVWCLTGFAVPVTFNVNMSVQRAAGNFDPDGRGDTVLVAGNWNNWATTHTMTPSSQPDVYTLTLDLAPYSWPNYKFIINPYGSSSGPNLRWESRDNRWFQVPPDGTNLPVVYFNDATSAVVAANITFQVDMSAQIALGNFNPDQDLVYVAGDWNWSAMGTGPFARSAQNPNIWTFVHRQTNSIGAVVNYKFIIYRSGTGATVWEADGVGPGGARNRQYSFPFGDTNLPVVFFNNITSAAVVVVAPVTFQVNLAVQDAYGNFSPGLDSVSVAGEFNEWNAAAWQLTPTETNQDLYVGTFNVTN